jgi:hypothetical protein
MSTEEVERLIALAGSCPPAPVPDGVTPVEEAAAKWLHDTLRGYWGWADALDDARDLLAAIDGPEPDWADVREAARKAGITFRLVRHREMGWSRWIVTAPGCDIELRDSSGDWMASFSTSVGYANRVNPTPAQVLAMARLVGLGGDSDEA